MSTWAPLLDTLFQVHALLFLLAAAIVLSVAFWPESYKKSIRSWTIKIRKKSQSDPLAK